MGFLVLLNIWIAIHLPRAGYPEISPYVLTVASLIPLGISMGIVEEYYPQYKRPYKWFALIGFLAIAISAIAGLDTLRKISVPVFHGVAGLVIFLGPFFAKECTERFLVGGHWWAADWIGRYCPGVHLGWCTAVILQP